MSNDEEIGYGRPPKSTRFRKGRSGNPKGRPRGSKGFGVLLDEVLNAWVQVKENGQSRKMTSLQATLKRLAEKAMKGEIGAINRLVELAQQRDQERSAQSAERGLSAEEERIIGQFEKDIRLEIARDVESKSVRDDGDDA